MKFSLKKVSSYQTSLFLRRCLLLFFILLLLSSWGCATRSQNHLTQTSTIDALLAGVYDGEMSCGELLDYGNFGIGTFDHLDGEMVVLDGTVYQVKIDGRVYQPAKSLHTPFACVCDFAADKDFVIKPGLDYSALKKLLDETAPNQNVFVAVRIDGRFKRLKVRSVPAQTKPYQPLAEVVKHQQTFILENVEGTVVGFRSPPFVKGINVPGYHFHFLNRNRDAGGHILELETLSGVCKLDTLTKFTMVLPKDQSALAGVDLGKDRSHALEKVER